MNIGWSEDKLSCLGPALMPWAGWLRAVLLHSRQWVRPNWKASFPLLQMTKPWLTQAVTCLRSYSK